MRPALEERYEVASLSRSGAEGIPADRDFRADISDMRAIKQAFEGVDTVVHLSADGGVNSSLGADATWESLLKNNIVGTYNVFESAKLAGVRRVVFCSSGATITAHEQESPYREIVSGDLDMVSPGWRMVSEVEDPRPLRLYGVSKLFGEDLARMYVETTDMSFICLRLGGLYPDDRPSTPRSRSIYLSHRDMADMTVKCIEAPADLRFDVFFVVSNNRWGYRDISRAIEVVGYDPQDNAEDFYR